jgi:RNA polymerase subunit RPABC4/transcription elongation factor Spt4
MDACVRCKVGIPDGSRACAYCEAPQVGKVSKSADYYDALVIIALILGALFPSLLFVLAN